MVVVETTQRTSQPVARQHDPLASDIGGGLVVSQPVPTQDAAPLAARPARRRWREGWQIGVAVAGWPLWWAIGVTPLVFPVLAVPLAIKLLKRRRVRVPPGFWLWALFLLWVTVSALTLNVDVEGTLPASGGGRYLAFAARLLNYVALTVMMLFIANASERELPRRRVIGWFAALGVQVIALGVLALAFPRFQFQTPFGRVFSGLLGGDRGHAALAQVQSVLGEASPRPAAPFPYTNAWGNSLSLLLVWVVVSCLVLGGPWRKLALWPLLAVAAVPIVYSLNRGVWMGLGLSLLVAAVRIARRGRMGVLAALAAAMTVASIVFAVSPLATLAQERVEAGHSNDVRTSLAEDAVSSAVGSPVVGYGSTRATLGSGESIAVGRSADCPKCGNFDIGSTGQLWLVLIAQGVVGAAFYVSFLLYTVWTHRRDHSVLGIAGTLVVALEVFYSFFYTALTIPLAVTLLTVGLLSRNAEQRAGGRGLVQRPPYPGRFG
jgi:hypothetical protein